MGIPAQARLRWQWSDKSHRRRPRPQKTKIQVRPIKSAKAHLAWTRLKPFSSSGCPSTQKSPNRLSLFYDQRTENRFVFSVFASHSSLRKLQVKILLGRKTRRFMQMPPLKFRVEGTSNPCVPHFLLKYRLRWTQTLEILTERDVNY